jgi:sporulation protein YlmC with PRC-barrel domain
MLKALSLAAAMCIALSAPAFAQGRILTSVPQGVMTVTDWYKQSVYDPNDKKVGTVADVLIDKDGKVAALIVAVGGFVGLGAKDVAVSPTAVKMTTKNDKTYLVMDTTKEELTNAAGYRFDRKTRAWIPAEATRPPTKKKA